MKNYIQFFSKLNSEIRHAQTRQSLVTLENYGKNFVNNIQNPKEKRRARVKLNQSLRLIKKKRKLV